MKAEYFPPREEIILFIEAPSELYIVVNGSVVSARSMLHKPPGISFRIWECLDTFAYLSPGFNGNGRDDGCRTF